MSQHTQNTSEKIEDRDWQKPRNCKKKKKNPKTNPSLSTMQSGTEASKEIMQDINSH